MIDRFILSAICETSVNAASGDVGNPDVNIKPPVTYGGRLKRQSRKSYYFVFILLWNRVFAFMVPLLKATHLRDFMFKTDKIFIWPADGIESGETERREFPHTGFFAVKFGRGHLEQAMHIQHEQGIWSVHLDGFLIASPSHNWQAAFGKYWTNAVARSVAPMLLGRRLNYAEFSSLIVARIADKERGIDLSAAVDLNSVAIPF